MSFKKTEKVIPPAKTQKIIATCQFHNAAVPLANKPQFWAQCVPIGAVIGTYKNSTKAQYAKTK